MERVKTELSEAGLVTEEWGGDTPMVPVGLLFRAVGLVDCILWNLGLGL